MPACPRSLRRPVTTALVVLSALSAPGCTSWRPIVAIRPAIDTAPPARLFRFTTQSGVVHELREVTLQSDSVQGQPRSSSKLAKVRLAATDIARADYSEFNGGKTVLGFFGVILGTLGALVLLFAATWDGSLM